MTAADRYAQPSRRRQRGPSAVTLPREFVLDQIRSMTVQVNGWRALLGLPPVDAPPVRGGLDKPDGNQ